MTVVKQQNVQWNKGTDSDFEDNMFILWSMNPKTEEELSTKTCVLERLIQKTWLPLDYKNVVLSLKKISLQYRRYWFNSWVRKISWRRDRLHTPIVLGFPCGSAGKESACNVGDLGLIPGLWRYPGEGNGYSLQYSWLENSTDRGAWQTPVHGVAKSQTT